MYLLLLARSPNDIMLSVSLKKRWKKKVEIFSKPRVLHEGRILWLLRKYLIQNPQEHEALAVKERGKAGVSRITLL